MTADYPPADYPPAADLRAELVKHPLPTIPADINVDALSGEQRTSIAKGVLENLNHALYSSNADALARCFFPDQAYWKDVLALTWHLRTFSGARTVAAALAKLTALRKIEGEVKLEGEPMWVRVSPVLGLFDCSLSFKTASPAAECLGRMLLLPLKNGEKVEWKIWCFSTWVDRLSAHPEDESRLCDPGRDVSSLESPVETDVFIVGAGNAGVSLAARLKALGVESILADRNARPGDNWALRYDYLKFHIPTRFADMAYLPYPENQQYPHLLTRDELAEQVRRYAETFQLNILSSTTAHSTTYNPTTQRWTVHLQTPGGGSLTVLSKHFVQATGYGSQKPYIPSLPNPDQYTGISIHSAAYKSAAELKEKGVKSVLIIGSANTAFDILQDCHAAGLSCTLVARSPTYVVPLSHICDPRGLGLYHVAGTAISDRAFMTLPGWVDGNLAVGLFAFLSSQEPDRYKPLAEAGFPVIDGAHPDACLPHNLLERAGGHYVDIGGTELIAKREVRVKAGVEPVGYTPRGLKFSDGSEEEADAVVWCTGFADKDARGVAEGVLGGRTDGVNGKVAEEGKKEEGVLGPKDIAARLDATWGVDCEGEIRGMWKRHAGLESYWNMGGHTQHHRWHSKTVALQIKAALEGVLPPAYRETPKV